MFPKFAFVCVLFFGIASQTLAAENWPQWRGPLATGVATGGDYPIEFSGGKGVLWSVDLPGLGSSTPAVWGEKVFVTCAIDDQDGMLCYDMSGREAWRRQFGRERAGTHRNGSGSNPSPVTDGEHVVVYFKSGTVACLDLTGKVLWQVNLQERYGDDTLWWDLGTSPVLAGDRAIIAVMQTGGSYLVALDIANGDALWKTPREYECTVESDQSYGTPQVVRADGRDVVVTWGAEHLTGHDAATGKLLWECGGFNPDNAKNWRTIASAAVGDGIAVVPYGRGKYLAGVQVGRHDHLWDKEQLGADVPTPIVHEGKAYLLTDTGCIVCLKLQSGDELWSANLPKNRNKYYASPVLAGDKLYCAREDGVVFVGRVSDDGYDQLAENDMGDRIIATPIPLRGSLLIRGNERLVRVGAEGGGENNTQRGE